MNRCTFLGRLAKEPTIRNTQNGGIVYNNSLAVTRSYKKEEEPDCDFIQLLAFGKTAEFMQKYMNNKGQQILVETHVQNRNWDDDQGIKHYVTEFIVDKCYFADTKKESGVSDSYVANAVAELKEAGANVTVIDSSDELPF